ncbi:aspartate kinase [Lysinibacillus fusiformis]|uniref:aspartate kinase n=1 Tax=Lysinibacillus fusiformis TaxID=28031 RepID=UPI000D38EDE4|nr:MULTISPECIES: aspartate kinase [Lysinibacillus]MED4670718.1 aspartate kinase [Lysinibacillus fusiformis]NOG28588.1 aspartate kinase [Lysinibacillus fusiformis]QAS56941.1 aspartate kinase [Lysinibacillus sphaericus]RDV32461.1 aspartate kinase [Lysinibacillus fusiformis]GED62508.1 aspartokinase 2 [Lysinibacillus fusiformis]
MSRIVMKFGGAALASPEQIQEAARKAIAERDRGFDVVVVVGAMRQTIQDVKMSVLHFTDDVSKRELDAVVSSCSQLSSSVFAIAIQEAGYNAVSLTGWQAGISTDHMHSHARINHIDVSRIDEHLLQGQIVVIAGDQGIDNDQNITTLGKGGTETTAVALAVALDAERIDIYTNVDGVYTADPRFVVKAQKLQEISYDEMLEIAHLGSHIIHPRAVELAKKFQMPVIIRSSLVESVGTLLKEEVEMEKNLVVRGVAFESDVIRLTIGYDAYSHASLADIFSTLAENRINVDIIVQAIIDGLKPTVSFSILKEEFAEALRVLEDSKVSLGFSFADFEIGLAKVSIVGSGMVSNPGVAARMFDRLRRENIPVKMVSTSEIKVSVVVPQDEMIRAANALHDEFNLEQALYI